MKRIRSHGVMKALICAVVFATSANLLIPLEAAADRYVRRTTRTSVHGHNRHVNVNRNVNVDIDRHGGRYRHVDIDVHDHHHPVATAVAVTAAATLTAAVVGSIVYSLPPSCSTVIVGNVAYQQCGPTWYSPRYVGTEVQYIVVSPPR